jgi:hypothetical protein
LECEFAQTLASVDGFEVSGKKLALTSDGASIATFASEQ